MTLPFSRLSCSVLLFVCMPCPQLIILYCWRRSYIRCVDDLTITLQSRSCNSLRLLFRFSFTHGSEFLELLQCFIVLNSFKLHDFAISETRDSVFRSFFFFACLACNWSFCIIYVDLIFVALTTWLLTLQYRPCNSLQLLFRFTFTHDSEFL